MTTGVQSAALQVERPGGLRRKLPDASQLSFSPAPRVAAAERLKILRDALSQHLAELEQPDSARDSALRWVPLRSFAERDHDIALSFASAARTEGARHAIDWLSRSIGTSWIGSYALAEVMGRRSFPVAAAVTRDAVDDELWARVAVNLRGAASDHLVESDLIALRSAPDPVAKIVTICDRCACSRAADRLPEPFEYEPVRISPLEALRMVAIGYLLRQQCIDASRRSKLRFLLLQRRSHDASSVERSPGELAVSSGRAPRGPSFQRVTQTTVIRGELLPYAA